MTTVAAIDIGTNTVRLLIAECDDPSGPLTRIVQRDVVVRLGEGVHDARALQPEPIRRTLAQLEEYRTDLDAHGNPPLRIAATSACRDAANREDFFDAVEALLGVRPELLSGEAEAALSFTGAVLDVDTDAHPGPYLIVDIGGGSTELVYGTDAPKGAVSLDVGCVRITEQFLASDPPAPEELSNAVGWVRDLLTDVDRSMPDARLARTCLAVAGTPSALALIEQGATEYTRNLTHGFVLTRPVVEELFRLLATETAAERLHNPGLAPDRNDVIVAGNLILAAVMRHYELAQVVVSEADLLDGLARSQA